MSRHRSALRFARAVLLFASLLATLTRASVAPGGEGAGHQASPAGSEHSAAAPAGHTATPPAEVPGTPAPASAPEESAAHGAEADRPAVTITANEVPPVSSARNPNDLTPEEITSLLRLGADLTERADYPAAEIAFHQVLKSVSPGPEDTKSALLGLARMHRRQGNLTKAAAIYERFLKDFPGDARTPDALLELGRTLRAMGSYKLSIARFYSVINSTLKMPGEGFEHYQLLARTAQYEIAETHFQSGNFLEANKFFSRLRLLDLAASDRARAHFKAAYALFLAGELEASTTALRAYLEQWPGDENAPEARYVLAMAYRGLKRPQQAFAVTLDLLRDEQARQGGNAQRWAYWQRRTGNLLANDFFESGDALSAQVIYSALADLSTEPSWRLPVTYQLALCYERMGMTVEAGAAYERIVQQAAGATAADLQELGRMAAWRREQLAWRTDLDQQMNSFFNTGPATAAAAGAATPSTQVAATP